MNGYVLKSRANFGKASSEKKFDPIAPISCIRRKEATIEKSAQNDNIMVTPEKLPVSCRMWPAK